MVLSRSLKLPGTNGLLAVTVEFGGHCGHTCLPFGLFILKQEFLMLRAIATSTVMLFVSASVTAQPASPSLPPDLANLPQEIKSLQWQSIDLNSVSALEYNRALLLMNDTLGRLATARAAEAELMSSYIESNNLGQQFTASPAPAPAKHLSYEDAVKVSVALLRGPMSDSTYSGELAGVSIDGLNAYKDMYDNTCRGRWSQLSGSLQQLRYMSAFLQKQGKMQDYQSWAKLESENRQLKYQVQMAQKQATAQQQQAAPAQQQGNAIAQEQQQGAQLAAMQSENQQLQQSLAAAQSTMQQQAATNAQQQQQLQEQQSGINTTPGTALNTPYYGYYGNPYAYGYPSYYNSSSGWCNDHEYAEACRASTTGRINNWHGAGTAGRGVGGGRR